MHGLAQGLILNIGPGLGYPLVFAAVAAESAGIPVPGETALITAAAAASRGRLHIALVITIASVAAILGDNGGYLIGRSVGRRILEAPGPRHGTRRRVLERGEPFFARYGPRAVFLGRWITGLRTWASWLAGAERMPWRAFAVWNAAGGIAWATSIGLLAYALGHTVNSLMVLLGALTGLTVVAVVARARRTYRFRDGGDRSGSVPTR